MNDHREVTAVIPAFNAGETIGEAVESVRAQTLPADIVVVDDGSPEPLQERMRARFPDVRVIRQANSGAGGARNTGIRAVHTDYVAFLDADDLWAPDFLEHLHGVLTHYPGAAGVLARSVGRMPAHPASEQLSTVDFRDLLMNLKGGASTSGWFFRRTALTHVGGFDTRFRRMQDIELLIRLTGLGFTVLREHRALFHYRPSRQRGNVYGREHIEALALFANLYGVGGYPWAHARLGRNADRQIDALMAMRASNVALRHGAMQRGVQLAQRAWSRRADLPPRRRCQAWLNRSVPGLSAALIRWLT